MASLMQLAPVPFFIPGAGQEARMPLAGPYPVHPCHSWEASEPMVAHPSPARVPRRRYKAAEKRCGNVASRSIRSTVGNTGSCDGSKHTI